jgi:stearoyl-CoA desaturase (Delta-9 desaturase)
MKNIGKDASTAFFGGVYDHSNAAHNLLAMMRVGVLRGGLELESEKSIPPSQKLRVVEYQQIRSPVAMNGVEDVDESRKHR